MKKIVAAALLIGLLSLLPISAPAAQAGDAAEAVLPVQVRLGGRIARGESFTVTLKPLDQDAPMPDSAELTLSAGETDAQEAAGSFVIRYTAPGIYRYRVAQRQGVTPGITYDTAVYYVTVTVFYDGQGMLQCAVAVRRNAPDAAKKSEGITFSNRGRGSSHPPSDPAVPASGKLIQTGQLNWPVPVLGGSGAALLLAGCLMRRKGRRTRP